jgi:hypothetical protein
LVEERPFDVDFLRDWLPDDRVLEEEPARGLLLFDDAGGEDVRVAMVTNLRDRHSCHRLHTPGAAYRPRHDRRSGATRMRPRKF